MPLFPARALCSFQNLHSSLRKVENLRSRVSNHIKGAIAMRLDGEPQISQIPGQLILVNGPQ